MGTFCKETITNATTNYGTNLKALVQWLVSNAGLEILATNKDTTDVYDVVLGAFGSNDVAIRIYNSSEKVYMYALVRSSSGSTSYGAVTDYVSAYNLSTSMSLSSTSIVYRCYACVSDTAIHCNFSINGSSNSIGFCFAKFTDSCSGKTIHACNCFSGNDEWYGSVDGDFSTVYRWDRVKTDNGYVRASPLECYSSGLSFCGWSNDYYQIMQNGTYRTGNLWDEISIGGHNFVCVNGNYGLYIKIS